MQSGYKLFRLYLVTVLYSWKFKFIRRLFIHGLLFLVACKTNDKKAADKSYPVETTLSFYDPYDEDFFFDTWIRKSGNIRIIHETLKKYGYSRLFNDFELKESNCGLTGELRDYVSKPCLIIVDSLLITYPEVELAPKYYREFWLRRRNEKNDTTVYEVLKEIKAELIDSSKTPIRSELVNDTILNLVRIKNEKPRTDEEALTNFIYLKNIGLHGSAYNLLYERHAYYEIKWDREQLEKDLTKDTIKCCPESLIEDDTK